MRTDFDPDEYLKSDSGAVDDFDPDEFLKEKPGILESGLRGAAQGLSFGLADEGTAALESMFSDKKYEQALAESRKAYHESEKANPIAYNVGDIGGSIATSFVPGLGALNVGKGARLAEVAGKAAIQGGLSGFGHSEKEGLDLAKDTIVGAGIGGALGTAAHGVGKGIGKASAAARELGSDGGFEHGVKAFREGTKEGRELFGLDISNMPVVSQISQLAHGAKKAIKEVGAFADEKAAISKTFGPGSLKDLSDVDVQFAELAKQGIAGVPTRAQQLTVAKFAQIHGGDADRYLDIIRRSPEELKDALGFDVIKATEELAPFAQSAYDVAEKSSGDAYERLSAEARKNFHKKGSYPVGLLNTALKEADRYESISDTTRKILRDSMRDLDGHEGQAPWKAIKGEERFDRLLSVKRRLSNAINWASEHALNEDQQLLLGVQQKFNGMLKKLDDMADADGIYSTFAGMRDDLFKKIGTVKRGKIQAIDPIKLEALFSASKTGRGLSKHIEAARAAIESGRLPPESEKHMRAFLDMVDRMSEKAALKRNIEGFKQANGGPTSMAVDRMASMLGKDGPAMKAINAPRNFIGIKASLADASKKLFGKETTKLDEKQMIMLAKYMNWLDKNPGSSDVAIDRFIESLRNPKFKP